MTDVVRCPACGQANRIPDLASGKAAVCGKCKAALPAPGTTSGRPVTVTDANFRKEVATGATVVDFWAAWCRPCQMIAPVIEALAAEHPEVRFAKLNVDDNGRTAAEFRVSGIPTLVFMRNGEEVGRVVGAASRNSIEESMRQYFPG